MDENFCVHNRRPRLACRTTLAEHLFEPHATRRTGTARVRAKPRAVRSASRVRLSRRRRRPLRTRRSCRSQRAPSPSSPPLVASRPLAPSSAARARTGGSGRARRLGRRSRTPRLRAGLLPVRLVGDRRRGVARGTRRADFGGVFEWRTLVQRCTASSCTATYPTRHRGAAEHVQLAAEHQRHVDVRRLGGRLRALPGGRITRPTIHHWNGSAWSIVPNPVTSGALYGVSAVAPNDVWAVGEDYSSAQRQLVLHWDGSSWTKLPFSIGGTCAPSDYFYDIAADGKRPMVISECRVEGQQPEPMVASYKNGAWKREAVPVAVPEDTNLYAVAWVGKQAWVGGGGWTSSDRRAHEEGHLDRPVRLVQRRRSSASRARSPRTSGPSAPAGRRSGWRCTGTATPGPRPTPAPAADGSRPSRSPAAARRGPAVRRAASP